MQIKALLRLRSLAIAAILGQGSPMVIDGVVAADELRGTLIATEEVKKFSILERGIRKVSVGVSA
jgi:hypothetical protein